MKSEDLRRFQNLSYEDFRRAAGDASLSRYEKIGFPDLYRAGKEQAIFTDIVAKLPALMSRNKTVLDIGPGCSELPQMLIELCRTNDHHLVLIDSAEMLEHLANAPFIEKIAGCFPHDAGSKQFIGKVDIIVSYSVLHYVFTESNIWSFLDCALELLAAGGELLFGDIPNVSKRKRFFASEAGRRFHRDFTGTNEDPSVLINQIELKQIDDAVIFGLISRARAQGFEAWALPQPDQLPMANRREDILIRRP